MPKGYELLSEPGAPQVWVPKRVLNTYGEPSVKNDSLGKLFEEDLKLPAEDIKLKFYKGNELGEIPGPLNVWRIGYRTPYSNTLHIPVWSIGSGSITPMSKVIALGLAMSEKRSQKPPRRFLATEVTLASAPAVAAGIAADSSPLTLAGSALLVAVAIGKASTVDPYHVEHGQKRELVGLRQTHDRDIVFPRQRHLEYEDTLLRTRPAL